MSVSAVVPTPIEPVPLSTLQTPMTVSRDALSVLVKCLQALLVAAWPYRRDRSQGLSGPYDLRGERWPGDRARTWS